MRRFLTRFTLITGWGLLGISLPGFGAAHFWILDLSNHFRVQYLAGGFAGIVAGMALRSKSAVLLFCCIAGINVFPLIPLFIPRTAPADAVREMSIVSYNTWRVNSDWNSVAVVLREEDPDIAFFAETHPDVQAGIRRLETAFHLFEANTDFLLVRRTAGLHPRRIASGSEEMAGIPLALAVGKLEVTLLAIHPAAPRSAATAGEHDQSFAAVASFLKDRTGPCIVLGDFNATPWSRSFRLLQEQTGPVKSSSGLPSAWIPVHPVARTSGAVLNLSCIRRHFPSG